MREKWARASICDMYNSGINVNWGILAASIYALLYASIERSRVAGVRGAVRSEVCHGASG